MRKPSWQTADKTTNLYELDKTQHEKLIQNGITTTFKKGSKNIMHSINQETKAIAERQAFISLKDHKENFANNPTYRLINQAKAKLVE